VPSISLTRPPPELPPQLRAEFEGDNDLLGEGAFAVVRRLRHRRTGEVVALKVVEKYPLHIRNMLPQLQREVRIQGNLQHRNILRLMSCLEDEAYVYMVLEHCAGGSLRSLCAQQPGYRLSEARAARYFAQILQGVDFMHQRLCVHRDLKPENMLLAGDDEVRICDFGWSAEVQIEQALRTTCGTPHYWPPELFEGNAQDVAVDLWALGTLIYELLVGHAPFWGNMEELRRKVLAVDLRYPPGVLSHEAINLFYCLLQRDPRNRISASQLLAEHPWVRAALITSSAAGAQSRQLDGVSDASVASNAGFGQSVLAAAAPEVPATSMSAVGGGAAATSLGAAANASAPLAHAASLTALPVAVPVVPAIVIPVATPVAAPVIRSTIASRRPVALSAALSHHAPAGSGQNASGPTAALPVASAWAGSIGATVVAPSAPSSSGMVSDPTGASVMIAPEVSSIAEGPAVLAAAAEVGQDLGEDGYQKLAHEAGSGKELLHLNAELQDPACGQFSTSGNSVVVPSAAAPDTDMLGS